MLLFAVTCLAGLIWSLGLVTSCFCPSRHGGPSALHVLLVPIKGIIRILLYIMKEVGLPVWQFRLPNINIFSRKPTWMTDLEGQRAGLPTRVVNHYSNASYRLDEWPDCWPWNTQDSCNRRDSLWWYDGFYQEKMVAFSCARDCGYLPTCLISGPLY